MVEMGEEARGRKGQEERERRRMDTLQNLLEMSEEILLDDLTKILEISRPNLIREFAEREQKDKITLRRDSIIIKRDDLAFINNLTKKFDEWEKEEKAGKQKKKD